MLGVWGCGSECVPSTAQPWGPFRRCRAQPQAALAFADPAPALPPRDGESHNLSWNCGEEGPSDLPAVAALRQRQMRNMAAALLLAHGVPMICMGDEYGHR